ncbi:ABC transporter ATP-binding protein [Millisia brevis]|uniref:ABC transporter ATP-binding protein n=1 Tax=Millisia brevis TaxID=264148 RepID=UPI000A0662C4|nr:ABC transporter ATP-binding protein [Millisia brevis]
MRLEIDNLTAGHGRGDVLREVSLTVGDGDVMVVVGPSGSGKTTLLRVIAGLHPHGSGRLRLGDRDLVGVRPEKRRIGLVPQDGALFPHLTVAGNVAYGLPGLRRRRAAARDDRVRELLAAMQLDGLADRMPHQLSGGQQQRVALARAMAPHPDLILLDEPFASLDASLREHVRQEVIADLRRSGITAMLITHDRSEALALGDRVAVLRDGRLVQVDRPADVYGRPVNRWVAEFVGEANVLTGTRSGSTVTTAVGELPVDGDSSVPDGPVDVLIRPEQLVVTSNSGALARVRDVRYFGHDVVARVDPGSGALLTVRAPSIEAPAPGDAVTVEVRGEVHVWSASDREPDADSATAARSGDVESASAAGPAAGHVVLGG